LVVARRWRRNRTSTTCRGTTPNYAALTPLRFLERGALTHQARASVVHGPVRYTWADTYSCCHRLASALTRRSVGHGSTVLRLGVSALVDTTGGQIKIGEPFCNFYFKILLGLFLSAIYVAMVILVPVEIACHLAPTVFPSDISPTLILQFRADGVWAL